MINRKLSENPLNTRQDLENAFLETVKPYLDMLSPGKALVDPGSGGATFCERAVENEGFSRILWGMTPFIKGTADSRRADEFAAIVMQGISSGTDPDNSEFWGVPSNYDQLLVEMAAFAWSLLMVPEKIWDPLDKKTRDNFARWLLYINEREIPGCNWVFFRILVNCALAKLEVVPERSEILDNALKITDSFFLDDKGWYNDGYPDKRRARDYYIPWAMQFYGLVFSAYCSDLYPDYARKYSERALVFSDEFRYWFSDDGSALPFGRSLTYRFAQAAFWSVLPLAFSEGTDLGRAGCLLKANLRWWFSKPIFSGEGRLSIGYTYPNRYMAERYNSCNSPLWAFKAFAALAVSDDHPFWNTGGRTAGETENCVQSGSGLHIFPKAKAGHHYALNAGQWTPGISNEHLHMAEKYSKFAYSGYFGFNVVTDAYGIDKLAADNMLLLTDDPESGFYRYRRETHDHEIGGKYLYSRWSVYDDTDAETWLVPLQEGRWHVRIHRIKSGRTLFSAEGGFPLAFGNDYYPVPDVEKTAQKGYADTVSSAGRSFIKDLKNERTGYVIPSSPNANIMYSRVVVPVLKGEHKPGETILTSAVYAVPTATDRITEPDIRDLAECLPEEIYRKIAE